MKEPRAKRASPASLHPPQAVAKAGAQRSSNREFLLWAGLIVLATLVAYLPALQAGFIWDDDHYVTRNPILRSLAGLWDIWFKIGAVPQYYPLVHTSFWIEYHLWGLNSLGYHLVNVLLHATASVLLWRVLLRLKLPGAWLVAAIFALHPVHVESVAWVTERKNVLSGVFYLAAALQYLRFVELKDAGIGGRPWRSHYVLALLLFVAALWSKTVACSLPAALLLVRWWQKRRLTRADILPTLPFFCVGFALAMVTTWMEKHIVGAIGPAWALSFWDRCLIAGRALWFYAAKLVWPVDLTFIYPRWEVSTAMWWQWLFPSAALAVVIALWRFRNRIGRGPLVATLFFAGTLLPALGFIDVYPFRYSFVADHFQYLASIGLILLAVQLMNGCRKWLAVPTLIVLGALTWQQAHIYRNLETLWRDTLAKNSDSAIAHNNLGSVLSAQGKHGEAEFHYREALRIEPDDAETLSNLAVVLERQGLTGQALDLLDRAIQQDPNDPEIHANLGMVLSRGGRHAEALTAYETAERLAPQRPEFYYDRGTVLATMGRLEDAMAEFRKALERRRDYPDAQHNLALALARQARYEEAVVHYQEAVRLDPGHVPALNGLGTALLFLGRPEDAVRYLNQAAQIQPDSANTHFNLARALAAQQRPNEAIAQFLEAVRLSPDHLDARNQLAYLLMSSGRLDEAIIQYQESLRQNPQQAEARFNLGNAYALQKNYEQAIAEFNEALRLAPDYVAAHRNLAIALYRTGRRADAIQHLQEALRLKPDYEEAKQQLQLLEQATP